MGEGGRGQQDVGQRHGGNVAGVKCCASGRLADRKEEVEAVQTWRIRREWEELVILDFVIFVG